MSNSDQVEATSVLEADAHPRVIQRPSWQRIAIPNILRLVSEKRFCGNQVGHVFAMHAVGGTAARWRRGELLLKNGANGNVINFLAKL